MIVLAAIPLSIWIYLLLGRSQFWRVQRHLAPLNLSVRTKRVVAVIPARDEAESITRAVLSLVSQVEAVIVIDDDSSDATAELAREAGATVLSGKPLTPGWTGKLWALSQGVAAAEPSDPDYLLLTDADVEHHSGSVQQLTEIAEARACDMASFMVKLHCETFAEKALIPAFVFFFFLLYPPGRKPGAAGGCILIQPAALWRAGGLNTIRSEVIDDCALARAVARAGGRVWLGLSPETHSIRSYESLAEVGRMISRTAFNQLRHSFWLLLGTVLGLCVTYLLPIAFLFTGNALIASLGAGAWLLMTAAYLPMVRFYGLSPLWSLSLPLIATFYMGATLHSAVRYWTGRGGVWKGRVQDVRPSTDGRVRR